MAPSLDSISHTFSNGVSSAKAAVNGASSNLAVAGSHLPTTSVTQVDIVEKMLATPTDKALELDGYSLNLGDVVSAARKGRTVRVKEDDAIRSKIDKSVEFLRSQYVQLRCPSLEGQMAGPSQVAPRLRRNSLSLSFVAQALHECLRRHDWLRRLGRHPHRGRHLAPEGVRPSRPSFACHNSANAFPRAVSSSTSSAVFSHPRSTRSASDAVSRTRFPSRLFAAP